MEIQTITIILDFIGTVLIAVMALMVHKRAIIEKHIDKKVIKEMVMEQSIGFIAILLLTISFILKIQL
jgi:hypothetical protein